MGLSKTIWSKPFEYLNHYQPEAPVMFFAPGVLQDSARRFIDGFAGDVAYEVKANPAEVVIENLAAAGLRGYDVGSAPQMRLISRLAPEAQMHHSAPMRSFEEAVLALDLGVRSFAVAQASELATLLNARAGLPLKGDVLEIVVQAAMDHDGMARAADLLRQVAKAGCRPSLGLALGAEIAQETALAAHLQAAADIALAAGVDLAGIKLAGDFPSAGPELKALFAQIDALLSQIFPTARPALSCGVGAGMVASSFSLTRPFTSQAGYEVIPAQGANPVALADAASLQTVLFLS